MTEALTATICNSASDIPAEIWNGLAPGDGRVPDNPFLEHAFFLSLEESGCATGETGWLPQHVLLEENGKPVGLMPVFLKSHSMGEYVFDQGWADAFERAGGHYYPKLQSSVPFTPATAPKLLAANCRTDIQRELLGVAEQLCARLGASSVHTTFIPKSEHDNCADAGWLLREDVQFHWQNDGFGRFDDFLDSLASRKRKAIRRERREALADGLEIRWITGSDLREEHWDAFYAFYMDTGSRKWGRPYLNRDFFSLIGERMADRVVLMFAYDGQEAIAGALNFLGSDRIYGRNWGSTRQVPFLHFELCYYQAIEFAIEHKLSCVEAGAQGEHKLARGYVPVLTYSAHHVQHAGLRAAIDEYLVQERRAVEHNQQALGQYTPFRRGEQQG